MTIGMPVYNGAAFIERAIASISEQDYPNFSVLVSDNASDDGTWEILEGWAARDGRIVLVRQAENIGAVGNFRYVLDHSDTGLFLWHAHDDWWEPNYLEILVGVLQENPECDVACGNAVRCMPDGREKKSIRFPALPAERVRRVRYMLSHPEATWFYGLYRAKALSSAQATAEEFSHVWTMDRVMILEFILNDRVAGSRETTFFQRTGELSSDRYRPVGASNQLRFLARFSRYHLKTLICCRLSYAEKALVSLWLVVHLARTAHLRIYKRWIKWPWKRVKMKFSLLLGRKA